MEGEQGASLSSRLLHGRRQVDVVLTCGVLTWREVEKSPQCAVGFGHVSESAGCHGVQVCEIVAVQEGNGAHPNTTPRERPMVAKQHKRPHPHTFTVCYMRRSAHHRWLCCDITFSCTDQGLQERWIQVISEHLALLSHRPRSLLVYINPHGGRRRAKWIYDCKVAPLFLRAGVSTDVIITERANHARDHLTAQHSDLAKYDGVVCVGGDGMFSEVLHGLVSRVQADHAVDQDQPDAHLVPCSLRIGIIPAGSTDCICYSTMGTNDPVTSALHIIVGDSQPMDVCSVHNNNNNTFLRYSVSLLGYGFYGDVLMDSERNRWAGPLRYDLAGVKTFLSHNYYEGSIWFVPAQETRGQPRDRARCLSGCDVCHQKKKLKQLSDVEEKFIKGSGGEWHVVRGKFLAVNAATMSCSCPRSPRGLSPSAHLADGTADLILVRKCSRLGFFRHLLRHTNTDDQFDHPFVEVHRVSKFRFQPKSLEVSVASEDPSEGGTEKTTEKTAAFPPVCSGGGDVTTQSSWTCDGEILPHSAIQVRVQRQLIQLFARGIENQ